MNSNPRHDRFTAKAAVFCAASAGVLALVGLASWWHGQWRLLAFGEQFVPMAPSTGLLLLLLSAAALLRARSSPKRALRAIETGCGLAVLLGAGLISFSHLAGFHLPVESWLVSTRAVVGEIPVGRMSPLTGGCLALLALARLCGRVPGERWRALRSLGGWFAMAVLLVSGLVVVGYLAGSPFLYGGSIIPMALLTGLTFMLASAAVILGAGCSVWPLRMFVLAEGREPEPRGQWSLLLLFLLLAGGIMVAGVKYVNHEQAQAREHAHQELEAIADLKVQQIANWRKERLTDANLIRATPYAARRALDTLAQPESSTTRFMFTSWLKPLLAGESYERALLLDAELNVRLVYPEAGVPNLPDTMRRAAEQALRTQEVVVTDLHRTVEDDHIHLDLLVPLVVRREGNQNNVPAAGAAPAPADRSAGVLVLQANALDFLFPLIQTWPTPSRTAETLLVRREGSNVLFLSELRHQPGSALTLRRPLDAARLPAAMGLRGEHGVQEGVDYRGVRVVAVVRPVPDTPWVMVAKVDEAELYAPMREELLTVAAAILMLLLTAMLGITMLWRRRNEHLLRTKLAAEHERRVLAERFEHLMKNASDAILLADEQNRILEANDRALALYGYSLAELQALPLIQLRVPELREDFSRRSEEMNVTGQEYFETRHLRKDGTTFPVEISSRLVEIGGQRYKLGIIRDISQRKAHEAEIERLNRLYATLSQVNQTIVRCQTREELFDDICRVVVEFGRFRSAWIGWKTAGDGALTTVARQSLAPDPELSMPGWKGGCGVATETLRTGEACLCNNALMDERVVCCREVLARLGVQSCAAFPLRLRGEVCGAFSICSIEPDFFNAAEIKLLEEVTSDISFALDRLDKEEQRRRAEAALQRSEADLQLALDAGQLGDWSWNIVTGEVVWSPRCKALYGLPPETVVTYERFLERVHPEDRLRIDAALKAAVANRADYDVEKRAVWPDGTVRWNATRGRVYCDAAGQPVRMAGVSFDITERKLAEEALRRSQSALLEAQRLAHIGNWESDNEGRRVTWSDELYRIYGRDPKLGPAGPQEVAQYFTPESWARLSAAKALALTRGIPYACDAEVVRADGTRRWVTSHGEALRDAAGTILGLRGTTQDITERKQAEEVVRRSQAALAQAGFMAHLGAWEIEVRDADEPAAGPLRWSDEVYRIFGYAPGEVEVTNELFFERVHPDDRECVARGLQQAIAEKRPYQVEHRIVRPDGTERVVLEHAEINFSPEGRPIRILGAVQDITEQREAELALAAERNLLRTLLDHLPDLVFTKDLGGRFVLNNASAARFLGFSESEMAGKTAFDVDPAELAQGYHADDLRVLHEGRTILNREEQIRDHAGGLHWFLTTKAPLRGLDGQTSGMVAVCRDITERKRAEALTAALTGLGLRLSAAREPTEAAQAIADVGVELFNWDACFLDLYDSNTDTITKLLYMDTVEGRRIPVQGPRKDNRPSPLMRRILQQGAELLLRERPESPGTTFKFGDTGRPSMSLMFVPVRLQGANIGVFSMQSYRPHAYAPQDLDALQGLADHCAGALVRLQTEATLAEEAVRRRILIEQSSDGIVVMRTDGGVLEANRRYAEMLGYSPEEVLQLHVWDWDTQWQRDQLLEMIQRVDEGGLRLETRHRRKDGTMFDVEITSNGVEIGGRKLVFAVCRDISERKQAEQALRRSEAFTRTVLNNLPVGIAVNSLSPTVSFAFMNDNFPRLYRTTREKLTRPDDFWSAVYEDPVFRDEIRKRILEDCASGDPARMFWQDIPIVRAGQPPAFITARNIPLVDEGLVISTVWDVTPQKEAEAALRASEEQFRAMFELASIGMAQADPQTGRWLRVNQRMCAITGYSTEEMLQMCVPGITHPEDRDEDWGAFQRVVRGEASEYHLEKRYVRKDGAIAWVSVNMTVIRDAAGEPVRTMATIEDISERRRLEEEREITVQLLGLLNAPCALRELIQAVTLFLRERFGCEAVGIRLREGDDFPYFETRGFPARFVELENQLCARDANGQPVRDREGNPVLECMCGNVLCGRFNPAQSFFTARGSFWANDTTRLLATTTSADRQANTRNRCNASGYESVALVALRTGSTTYGLVQLNDTRKHRFTPERIALLERLSDSLAIGIAHRQDQTQLQENEERLRLALAGANQGLYDLNVQTGAAVVSPEYARMLGYEPEELRETNAAWRDRLHPDDRGEAFQVYQDYIAGRREEYRVEFRQRTKAGDWKWILSLGRLVARDAEGKPLRLLGTHTDITERKLAEESIRRERILLRTVIDHLPDPIYVKDRRGAKTLANRAEIAWMGLQTEEAALGKTDFDIHPREVAVGTEANDQQILESGVPILNREELICDAKGQTHWVLTSRLPLRDASGGIVGLVGISHDITERKQADEQVRQLSRAVEQSPAAVVITNPAGDIQYVNPKFTALTGYTLDEARGKTPRILKSGETPPEVYRELWATIRAGGEWRGEFHNRKKNGELFWEIASISPIVDEAGRITHFLAVKEDITERKRLEQERAVMEAQLRQQQKLESIGTLASGVAHEINNPITGIMNYAQLIQDRLPTESPLTEFTGEIMHETQRVATIVRNLLTFSRNEKQSHSPARMVDIVEAVLSLVRTVIRHDQITLNVNVPDDLPQLKCRSQQLQQVIMNLMTNARDALNERHPEHHPDKVLNLEARLHEKEGRRWIRVTVEDHGTGITPEVRERMFDPFFTTKGRDQGTGLGLSISHGIVKEHHGELTVESEPGQFTRMHVDLPVDNGWNV